MKEAGVSSILIAVVLLALGVIAEAQQPKKVPRENYRRLAYFVDRILKGAKPSDLPVEQPTKFEFVINLKTTKQIGVTIPPDVLARATKIIR